MTSLRSKLWFGFGGLLAILIVVSATSVNVLTLYSHSLERLFHENYDSARYCDGMKAALDNLDTRAQRLIWDRTDTPFNPDIERFDTNLGLQLKNTTLPGERDLTRKLAQLWDDYKAAYASFDATVAGRDDAYRRVLLPRGTQLKQLAQQISDMNMNNMVSVDGQVKGTLYEVRGIVLVLAAFGTILATTFVGIVGASILRSIRNLTRSARNIEQGNLDLSVEVQSRDEIGQLAEAFNSMAGKLREFRRLDHDRLVRTQQTTQLAIDSLPDAVFVLAPAGKTEISNRIAQTHFGIAPGVCISDLRLAWLTELYQRVVKERKPFEPAGYGSAVQLFENGTERFLLPHAVPMLADDGSLLGVTVILVDVTRLRHADEVKSDLVSTVSHELRTPLTSIRMGTLMLSEEKLGPLNPRQRKSLDAVREESDRLHRIIENLLNMSRIEAGSAPFQFRPMSASDIVSQAVDPMRRDFAEKDVRLSVSIAPELPAVQADPSCVGLVLTNLLSNALKFTPAAGEVRLAVEAVDSALAFSVCDTGPGVPEEYAVKIFDKFFRISTQNGPSGAGLGLAIAKEIVEAHGGRIHLESSRPTRFIFTLPLASPNVDASTPSIAAGTVASGSPSTLEPITAGEEMNDVFP